VETIYARFGLPLSGAAADAIAALAATAPAGIAPAHQYTLEDFGLTGEDVDARFAALTW